MAGQTWPARTSCAGRARRRGRAARRRGTPSRHAAPCARAASTICESAGSSACRSEQAPSQRKSVERSEVPATRHATEGAAARLSARSTPSCVSRMHQIAGEGAPSPPRARSSSSHAAATSSVPSAFGSRMASAAAHDFHGSRRDLIRSGGDRPTVIVRPEESGLDGRTSDIGVGSMGPLLKSLLRLEIRITLKQLTVRS